MQFSSIVGQKALQTEICRLVRQQLLPHALLWQDAGGRGGLPFAIAAATYLLCENRSDTDSCGLCTPCRQMAKLSHPDVHYSFPTMTPKGQSKNYSSYYIQSWKEFVQQTPYGSVQDWLAFINIENRQANISVHESRQIIDQLSLTSFQNGYKVQIIWMPEYFSNEGTAGNMLLKLLEEPPPDTVIMLIAANTELILNTILSRVQLFALKPLAAPIISEALQQRQAIPLQKAEQLAQLAQGSYTQAIALANHNTDDMLPIASQLLQAVLTNDGSTILKWAEEQAKHGKEELRTILGFCQQLLQEALSQQYTGVQGSHAVLLAALLQRQIPLNAYSLMADTIASTTYHIQRQANAKIQLLAMCITLQYNLVGRTLSSI